MTMPPTARSGRTHGLDPVLTCYGRTAFGYVVWDLDDGEVHESSRTDLDRARKRVAETGGAPVAGEPLDGSHVEQLLDALCNPIGQVLGPCTRCDGPATHRTVNGERVCQRHAPGHRARQQTPPDSMRRS